jgi:four helix bundle protein
MSGKNYTDLIAWQKAMVLVETVYRASCKFPREEIYGLTSQLRRAAVSVPANIAEGQGRQSKSNFRHFLKIAHGSLREVETLILISGRLGYIDAESGANLLSSTEEIGRLINGLIRSIDREAQ